MNIMASLADRSLPCPGPHDTDYAGSYLILLVHTSLDSGDDLIN